MKIIYPKGSIITKKEDKNNYCIVKENENDYECVLYPIGAHSANKNIIIKKDEVDEIKFWGYTDNEIKEELKDKYIEVLKKKAGI